MSIVKHFFGSFFNKTLVFLLSAGLVLFFQTGFASALSPEQQQLFSEGINYFDAGGSGSCSETSSGSSTTSSDSVVDGSISSGVGKGMTPSAQKLFQQYVVAGAQKNNVDPNLLATFYYTEQGRTDDSTNNANADANPPVTGNGNWIEPAPPVGNGPPYITNSKGYGLYGLSASDYQQYGEDGDGDGKIDPNDLADAVFTAAGYLKGHGYTGTASPATAFKAGETYNYDASSGQAYAHSVENTYDYLTGESPTAVSGTVSSDCSSGSTTTAASGTVAAAVAAAEQLSDTNKPYPDPDVHYPLTQDPTQTPAYDCSQSVSWVLLKAGFKLPGNVTWGQSAPASEDYANWGDPGPGQEMTVWVDPGYHVFIEFNVPGVGHYQLNTTVFVNGVLHNGPDFAPWGPEGSIDAASGNFVARHWPGT